MTKLVCPLGEEHKSRRKVRVEDQPWDHIADLNLYHWSPRSRRKQIEHDGLVPGKLSVERNWRPPYVCFSDDAALAWSLSGRWRDDGGIWDLWQTAPHLLEGFEVLFDTYAASGRHFVKEYRVYHRVPKRNLFWLGSRGD